MKNIFIVLEILIFTALLSACENYNERNHHEKNFVIELDGEIDLVSYELAEEGSFPNITLDILNQELSYARIPKSNYHSEEKKEIEFSHQQLFDSNNGIVDNSIYQFVVTLPIKTKQDLSKIYGSEYPNFLVRRCERLQGVYFVNMMHQPKYLSPSLEGYYHYTLYVESNQMASEYLLNQVRDLCVSYGYSDGTAPPFGVSDTYGASSNEITIPFVDIENMLLSKGILHD